jgi:hypothetical protein
MFILDSLMISGIQWALRTAITAAEAEMNDDSALRDALLAAEMQREMGEISDEEFRDIETDLLARIREIKERREGGSGPIAFGGAQPMEITDGSRFQIEAEVSGDFHERSDTPHTDVITVTPTSVEEVLVTPVRPPVPRSRAKRAPANAANARRRAPAARRTSSRPRKS